MLILVDRIYYDADRICIDPDINAMIRSIVMIVSPHNNDLRGNIPGSPVHYKNREPAAQPLGRRRVMSPATSIVTWRNCNCYVAKLHLLRGEIALAVIIG